MNGFIFVLNMVLFGLGLGCWGYFVVKPINEYLSNNVFFLLQYIIIVALYLFYVFLHGIVISGLLIRWIDKWTKK